MNSEAHRHVIGKIVLFQFSTLQRELQSTRNIYIYIYDKLNIPVKTAVFFPSISIDRSRCIFTPSESIEPIASDSALYLRGTQLDETFFCHSRIDKSNIRGCFVFLSETISQPKDARSSMPCYFEYSISIRSSLLFDRVGALTSTFVNFVNLIDSLNF